MLKIAVIVGSTRHNRVGRHVADWFMNKVANNQEAEFELIDLKDVNLPFLDEPEIPSKENYKNESTISWSETIKKYDGYVLVTAEYNHGPPAPLKNALDTLYVEWDKKPVAFVGYGAYGAARAIEQLVSVASKIGMVPLTKTVVGLLSLEQSVRRDGSIDETFIKGKVENLTNNLLWWANKLAKH